MMGRQSPKRTPVGGPPTAESLHLGTARQLFLRGEITLEEFESLLEGVLWYGVTCPPHVQRARALARERPWIVRYERRSDGSLRLRPGARPDLDAPLFPLPQMEDS